MIRLDGRQGELWWYEARCGIPTVSEFSRFITPARGGLSKQAEGYIADLIVEMVQGPSEGLSSFYMDRGSILEDEARSDYELRHDVDVEVPGLIINEGAGWSPDGFIPNETAQATPDHGDQSRPGGCEFKCAKPSTHVKWLLDGGLPTEHKPQCHGAIVVGELAWLDFVSYCPGFPTLEVRITPNDYTDKVRTSLAAFIESLERAARRIVNPAYDHQVYVAERAARDWWQDASGEEVADGQPVREGDALSGAREPEQESAGA